ncbi:MAG: DsrE family protein [Acidiferrobacterales bacterium]
MRKCAFRVVMSTITAAGYLSMATAQAATLKDTDALAGLTKAKAVFMIDVNNPQRVAHVLEVVRKTDTGMRAQGVKPTIVVVFVGPDVAFLTKDRRGISYMKERSVAGVQDAVGKLNSMGVKFQACGVALKGMDVAPSDVIPDVQPVGNGYISAIGYQAKGYSLVPVY